jgi:hypothetical protein
MSTILGLDPGASTGVAVFQAGALWKLETIAPHEIADYITKARPVRVIFEDSRLTSFMFTTVKSRPAALKMARNVGQVDAWSSLITSVCANLCIPCHGVSPKGKGKKLDAKQFALVTGWVGKSNEHERDSAMVAWNYRGAAV